MALVDAGGSFFHHPEWIRVVSSTYRYEVYWLAAVEEESLVGGLPLARVPSLFGRPRLVSFPFSYAAGPLATSSSVEASLLAAARDLARDLEVDYLEVKQIESTHPVQQGFERVVRYATYIVRPSSDEDSTWKASLDEGTRRSIRKGWKEGVAAIEGDSLDDWSEMCRLAETTFHRLGVPSPPRQFFMKGCRDLQLNGLADLLLAKHEVHGSIAGVIIWKGRRSHIYAYGASDPKYVHLRPNHVLLWEGLRRAIRSGVTFDLGRAAPEQLGLVEFKRRWGGAQLPLAYDFWPSAHGLNTKHRDRGSLHLISRLWPWIPAPLARAGSALYRYLG
jgi:hypothetical protein